MKETFTWIPWFSELAEKIAEGDQESLKTRATRIEWGTEAPFSSDDAIEPLGLGALLARHSKGTRRRDTFLSAGRAFELRHHDLAEASDAWDLPDNWHLTAHLKPQEQDLRRAWTIFRQAISGSVDRSAFSEALKIKGIALKSLSTMLFLVNPKSFLPLVDYPTYLKILGLTSIPPRMPWEQYASAIKAVRTAFPGCDLWEIELFGRLQRSENVGGRNMVVRPDRCWVATTNARWGTQVGDQWSEFRENYWVRVENSSAYPVERPKPGHLMLARYGDNGRGIGVVHRNDYGPQRNPEGRIHVLWLNTRSCEFEKPISAKAFAEASESEMAAFRQRREYIPTWDVLEGTSKELALWVEFLEVWPPNRVQDMSLEDYTNLNRDDAFVYWLEKRTEALGSVWGGSAFKFGIYRREETSPKPPKGGRIWGGEYAWMRKYGNTEEEAFSTVRSRLARVIDAAREGDFEALDGIDFSPAIKWKVAFLYQDRQDPKLLAIYSEERVRTRYKEVFPDADERTTSQQHAALIKHYSRLGGVLDISRTLWEATATDRRYWLMSLGRQSSRWPTCYENGTASIGFEDHPVGDLHEYGSLEEVGQAMEDVPGVDPRNTRLALWQFSNEMEPGHVIFVKRGQHHVVGHGTVKSQYRHVPTNEQHKHVRDVEWESNLLPKGRLVGAGHQLPNKTLTDVTPYPDLVAALEAAANDDAPPREEHPANQVLYGPPGTGKTYSTVSHALAIVDGVKPNAEITEQDGQRFRLLRFKRATDSAPAKGQIAMVTFHQNYAYEDFVEGIRPALTTTDGDRGATSAELGYELRPGIFRTICEAASATPDRNFVLIIDEINRGNIPKIFGELITLIEESRRLGEDDATTVTLPYSGDDFGVPENLHLIGTMNTADRSIQQLDTALRRRFTFVEMMPNPDHELISRDVEGVNCREMLRAMNERIALLMDREHQIGHTYLLNVQTMDHLAYTFRNRVFPLLQEYFYDDWRKVRAVLGGNAFVKERKIGEGHTRDLAQEFDLVDDEMVVYERLPLDDPAWEDASEYKTIYENPDGERLH